MTIFWSIIALFYLVLAIVTFVCSRPIKKNFTLLEKEGPDSFIGMPQGDDVSLNSTLNKAYKTIIITDIIGFILAAIAATIPAIFASG